MRRPFPLVAALTASVRSALLSGGAYANVRTARNPGGEIRGQVTGGTLPPAPSTTESQPTTTDDNGGGYGGYGG